MDYIFKVKNSGRLLDAVWDDTAGYVILVITGVTYFDGNFAESAEDAL